MLLHVTKADAWAEARASGSYRPVSLAQEGFVHLSTATQWERTLRRFFHGEPGLVLLFVDESLLPVEVRYEPADGELFPHLYAALPASAVVEVATLDVDADGVHRIRELASERAERLRALLAAPDGR